MAANILCVTLSTTADLTGGTSNVDGFTARYGTGAQTYGQGTGTGGGTAWAPTGVGWGGAAVIAREVARFMDDFAAGPTNATATAAIPNPVSITVMDGITPATQTLTFSAVGTVGDTVVINGSTLTAVANGTTPSVAQWQLGTTSAQSASNLAQAINRIGVAAAIGETVEAWFLPASALILYVTCIFGGVIGNLITISKTSTAIAVGGATLTGGASNQPITVQH